MGDECGLATHGRVHRALEESSPMTAGSTGIGKRGADGSQEIRHPFWAKGSIPQHFVGGT